MGFDPVQIIAEWLRNLLLGWGASDLLTEVILKFIGAFLVAAIIMLVFVVLTWVERKGAARFQDRIGPNRVGPFGLIQLCAGSDHRRLFCPDGLGGDPVHRDLDWCRPQCWRDVYCRSGVFWYRIRDDGRLVFK